MLQLNKICKNFDKKIVIKDFSYNFEQGRTVCLFGDSGCGKSTLLNIISGILKQDSGEIIVDKKLKIRMVFQEPRLLPWKTALENVCISGSDVNGAIELLSEFSLESELNNYPENLSGGMCFRIAIARALNEYPDILLLDEPFNGLDEGLTEKAVEMIKQRMQGKLIIFVTHNRELALKISDTILYLSKEPMRIQNEYNVNP